MRISIDGGIGAGKTTVFETLARRFPEIGMFTEPVRQWEDLLALYYKDPATWSLPLNIKVLLSFRESVGTHTCVVERSPMSCLHVFAKIARDDGVMNAPQWDLFKEIHEVLGWKPDAVVFIDTPVAACLDRIEARGRACESEIDIQYVRRIEYQYAVMLKECGVPVVRVNGAQSPAKVAAAVGDAVQTLLANNCVA